MITVDSVNGKSVRMVLELTCTDKDTLPTNATGGVSGYAIANGSTAQVISISCKAIHSASRRSCKVEQ